MGSEHFEVLLSVFQTKKGQPEGCSFRFGDMMLSAQ
jgi:hypothetical protein